MADYYRILEIDPSADSTQLRAAYKRLALLYHPDRNPGDPEAEENFKAINEAYHVLSDPLKRSRYDAERNGYTVTYSSPTEDYWRDVYRQQYQRWKASQRTRYRFDREYFRIQGLAFLTFLVIAGFCFGVINLVYYVHDLHMAEIDRQNKQIIVYVDSLFNAGQVDEAFVLINRLRDENPLEFRFYFTHDSLLYVIRGRAEREFNNNRFAESLHFLEILKKYESPQRLETLRKLAICEYRTGEFTRALQSLKHIFNQQPWNLDVLYQIGMINLVNLEDYQQANYYFTLGKKIFKDNLTRIYGAAFEIVMDPKDAPEIYYSIFEARGRTNLILGNYDEAEKDGNWAVFLRPNYSDGYRLRALAKIKLNNRHNLCRDIRMAQQLGAEGMNDLQRSYCR